MAALVLENTMISLRGASWVPSDALSTYCRRTARVRLDDGWRNAVEVGSEEWLEDIPNLVSARAISPASAPASAPSRNGVM